jgi:hypothetical protein
MAEANVLEVRRFFQSGNARPQSNTKADRSIERRWLETGFYRRRWHMETAMNGTSQTVAGAIRVDSVFRSLGLS